MADLATLQTRLSEAEAALHQVLTGKKVEVAERDGRRVQYSGANPGDSQRLQAYIQSLKAEIATLSGAIGMRRPIGVMF